MYFYKMVHTTISMPAELHKLAANAGINVSLASQHGIRIKLGLNCPVLPPCMCFDKANKLQELLLAAQDTVEKEKKEIERIKNVLAEEKRHNPARE